MRLEDATLPLEPRSVGAAIDLAILFYRRHATRLVALTAIFAAGPLAIGAFRATQGDGWLWAGVSFFYGSAFLGAAVVAGAGHHVFGESFTVGNALRTLWRRRWSVLLLLPLARTLLGFLGILCWGIAWVPVAARYGFVSELLLLERLSGMRIGRRLDEILRKHFAEACGRYLAIIGFAGCVVLSMFLLLDLSCEYLLGLPVFFAKVSWAMAFEDVSNLLSYDPLLVVALFSIVWLVYPIARLAWFFCYLDARIRKEGWDVEIDFRMEARRLA